MHSATSRSSQSSLQSSLPNASTSSLLQQQQQQQQQQHHHHHHHHHHQQQQILYGPLVNPVIPLQPYAPGIHPTCIYPTAQRPAGLSTPISLQMQGKANRWQFKNKINRGQQQHQQQYTQQPFYNSKLVFEQGSNNPTLPSSNSSFVLTSSNFAHGGVLGETYNNSGVNLIPQSSYAKSPDNQAFRLLQDRDKSQIAQRQQSSARGSYYNVSPANACSLQTVNPNAFQLANVNPFSTVTSFTNSQITGPIQTVQTTQVLPNPQIGLLFAGQLREKLSENCTSHTESTSLNTLNAYSKDKLPVVSNTIPINPTKIDNRGGWPVQENKETLVNNFIESNPKEPSVPRTVEKLIVETTQEEGAYSDESSASFEFTLEAEKMVSALCNTTSSNDLSKEEPRNEKKSEANAFFDGAGDNPSNKNNWFSNFCTDESNKNESNKSIAIQTDSPCTDRSQYSELIRKTAYWGCTKAEIVLNSETLENNGKWDRLIDLSSATRTAITKSSTCFPIFAGDRIFAKDLIKALLRVSNGWLILDNYLNKQHYPSLAEKLDNELLRCFRTWEESTYELLRQIVETFLKLEENSRMSADKCDKLVETSMVSFPGDVTLYTSIDLFDCSKNEPNLKSIRKEVNNEISKDEEQGQLAISTLSTDSTQKTYRKETKLRSKWTITENLISSIGSEKSLNRTKNNVRTGSRFRNKNASSLSGKIDTSERSVNAEFFHLRSTVMERNHESSKEWLLKDRKQEFFFDNNIPPPCMNAGLIYGIQRPTTNMNYDPSMFGNTLARNFYPGNDNIPIARVDTRTMYENKSNIGAPVYIGKSSTDQLELSAVPKNRMTLLSQIEPDIPEKESEEMTANLSAWFASMRNANGQVQQQQQQQQQHQQQQQTLDMQHHSLSHRGETLARNTIDFTRQLQIDTNRQLQTLRNMQSIQSAPWNAEHILSKRSNVHSQITEEYDSSEDVRVYMKPGSYNVPKKRHHRKSNTRRADNLRGSGNNYKNTHSTKSEKVSRVLASSTPITRTTLNTTTTQSVSLHNSPTILKRVTSIKNNLEQDVTWKAACASAEILLEALNVKDAKKETILDDSDDDDNSDDIKDIKIEKVSDKEDRVSLKHNEIKSGKNRDDIAGIDASSYEASEDDSGSTSKLSPRTNVLLNSEVNRNTKTNVKTDSWLIRTLNNASMISKQRRRQNDFAIAESSESSNSSMIEEERTCLTSITAVGMTTTITATTTIKDREETIAASREIGVTDRADTDLLSEIKKDSESTVGRATYSETLRRSTGFSTGLPSNVIRSVKKKPISSSPSLNYTTIVPIPGRKCYNKDSERSYHLLHKSRKPPCKKTSRTIDDNEDRRSEDGSFSCSKLKMAENERRSLSSMINLSSKSGASKSFQCKKKGDNNDSIDNFVETKCGSKLNDRGWSVWYSSRRKQSLSPLALSKLETIYRTVCQMDETNIFKYPASIDRTDRSSTSIGTMKDYCKVIKNPLFLETVEYKIKHRIYHKIEHAVRDFRRIVYNSRIYHKNDNDRVKKIENLSKKLEELFEEHFTNWDFDNISGSPREDSPIRPKFKSTNTSQKTLAGRYGNSKKSPSTITIAESTSLR